VSGERQIRNRYLAVIATNDFDDKSYPPLTEVAAEVKLITEWFTDANLGDRRFVPTSPKLPANPGLKEISDLFTEAPNQGLWDAHNAAVVYITGHGVVPEKGDGEHYLILKETDSRRLSHTAIDTKGLLKWLADTDIENLLVIIDVCYAGQVAEQLAWRARESWLILPSSLDNQQAEQGALVRAIAHYLDTAKQFNTEDRHLPVGLFVDVLNQHLPGNQTIPMIYKSQRPGSGKNYEHDQHPCLPNPAYDPHDELVPIRPELQAVALPKALLDLHNQADGQVPTDDSPGWLFTGRERLMRELTSAVGKCGVTIVTGSAGSGKSAMLSRLVTLSDPGFRDLYARELAGVPEELMPLPGSVDVALSALGRANWQVMTKIRHDLLIPLPPGGYHEQLHANRVALSKFLDARKTPVTIIIDALDEADARAELVSGVLSPLVRDHPEKLCLILGVRSLGSDSTSAGASGKAEGNPLGELMSPELGARLIAVDDDQWWSQADVTTFVRNILMNTADSPYRNADGAAMDDLAQVISKLARRSYLVARIAAETAAEKKQILAPDDPVLLASLNEGLLGVFRQDLQLHLDKDDWQRGIVLLRALAFSRGTGLPRRLIWPTVADALEACEDSEQRYGDRDISWLLKSRLSAYLRTDQRDDLTVYRLVHDELRKILRYRWRDLLEPADAEGRPEADEVEIRAVEACIADELHNRLARVKKTDAVNRVVQPYIRRRLAEHALAGGVLKECIQPALLPYLDLARLRRAVGASPMRRRLEENIPWLTVIRQVTHLWDWSKPARNAAAIAMWAKLNEPDLPGPATEAESVGGPWQVDWAVRPLDLGDVLGHHKEIVRAVATAQLGERPVAVTGGEDGLLFVWDLKTGSLYRDRAPIEIVTANVKERAILAVAAVQIPDSRTIAVTGGADGSVRIWDLRSGLAIGEPLSISGKKIVAVMVTSLPDQRVVITAADEPGTVMTWDLATGEPVGASLSCGERNALGLTSALVDGMLLGLATGIDSGLQLWDLLTGRKTGDRLTGHPLGAAPGTRTFQGGPVVAALARGSRDVAITGNGDGLLLWDLRERTAIQERLPGGDGPIRSLAMARLDDGRILAVTGGSTTVQVWDLIAGEPVGGLLPGHDGSVDAIAITAMSDGSALAISGSRDTSVRAWEVPDAAFAPRRPSQQIGIVEAVATAQPPGEQPIAVTGSGTAVQVWDLERGGDPLQLTGHDSPVVSVTTAELPDRVLVTAGHWDGWISTWWATGGQPFEPAELGDLGAAASLATAILDDGRPIVLAGGWDGEVRLWDPVAGAPAGEPLRGHTDIVVAVCVTTSSEDRTLVVSGSKDGHVMVHDLAAHLDSAGPPLVDTDIGAEVASLAVLTGDPDRIVVGGEDGQVRLLDLHDGTPVGAVEACPGPVAAIATGRQGDRCLVFTGGEDALVQAWDVSAVRPDKEVPPVPGPVSVMRPLGEVLPVPGPVLSMVLRAGRPGSTELASLVVGGTGVAVARLHQGGR
jgi:WD40 repeat protein